MFFKEDAQSSKRTLILQNGHPMSVGHGHAQDLGWQGWLGDLGLGDRLPHPITAWLALSRSGKARTTSSALEYALIVRFGTLCRVPALFLLAALYPFDDLRGHVLELVDKKMADGSEDVRRDQREILRFVLGGVREQLIIRQISLAFEGCGRIVAMRAEEGDAVKAGAVLAVLDTTELALETEREKAQIEVQQQTTLRLHNEVYCQ